MDTFKDVDAIDLDRSMKLPGGDSTFVDDADVAKVYRIVDKDDRSVMAFFVLDNGHVYLVNHEKGKIYSNCDIEFSDPR